MEVMAMIGMVLEGSNMCHMSFSEAPLLFTKETATSNATIAVLFQLYSLLSQKAEDHKFQINLNILGIANNELVDLLSDDPIT